MKTSHQSSTLAIESFMAEMPRIVDYYSPFKGNFNNYIEWETVLYDSSDVGEPDEPWDKECPDHDHDCCREGCGRTVAPDYYVTGVLTARLIGSNKRVILAEWVNNYSGGYF